MNINNVEDYNTGVRDCTFYKSQFIQKEDGDTITRSYTATGYLNENIVTIVYGFCIFMIHSKY